MTTRSKKTPAKTARTTAAATATAATDATAASPSPKKASIAKNTLPSAAPAPSPTARIELTEAEERLENHLASSPSPFSDAVLNNAFRETPDVPSIHADARARCVDLIRAAREDGRTSLQVITGDAGEGKTHLIACLRRQSEEGWRKQTAGGRFALTVVPPLRSADRIRHHILQEVVRQLSVRLPGDIHIDEATDTPIEILIWRSLLAIGRILSRQKSTPPDLRARLEEVTDGNVDRYLSSCVAQLKEAWPEIAESFVNTAVAMPELAAVDREVFRVLAQFPDGDEPERTAIVDWLGGASLSSQRLEALKTNLVLDDEAEATRGLRTLLVLARFASTPIALAFDQIEGTARLGDDAVKGFLDTVAELYNDCPSTVLLIFCQTQLWPTLREQSAAHVRDRLDDSPSITLRALTVDEAVLLVETRMRHFWQGVPDGPSDPFFPLNRATVIEHVTRERLRTPRHVVRYFQSLLREPPERRNTFIPQEASAQDIVRRKLDTLLEEERRATRPPDTRASLTQSVLHDVLAQAAKSKRLLDGALVEEIAPHRVRKNTTEGLRVVLARGGKKKRVYVESSNREHGKSAASTMKRLADALELEQADAAVLLREESFPLPPVAKATLVEITPRGVMLRLTEGEIPPLAAIETLLNAAAANDLPVDRATALDIAVQYIESAFDIGQRIASVAFPPSPSVETMKPATEPPPDLPSVPSMDPRTTKKLMDIVMKHLRTERAFEPLSHLASSLGMSVESLQAATQTLANDGLVDLVADRNRATVVLLRPEGLQ